MDPIIFHIDADQVGTDLVERIKAHFGNRRVQITVEADDVVEKAIAASMATDQDYALPLQDITRIAAALERNESIDVMAEVKKFMDAK